MRDMLSATGGELLSGNPESVFAGISIDSRNITADDVFVAIVGDIHDGHEFVGEIIQKGVKAVIRQRWATSN